MKRRLLSLTMALALCLSLLPVTALAGEQVSYIQRSWDNSTNTVTQEEKSTTEYTAITSTSPPTTWGTANTTTWYVAQGEVTIGSRVTVTGDVHLILADNCTLTVNGGIRVAQGNSLTIYGQSEDETTMGKLIAQTSDEYNAAIGGNGSDSSNGETAGTITIHGGTVEATGDDGGAGIGGGTVTIYGGTVEATGSYGAGIGGGPGGNGGEVTIYGGTVEATGGSNGAGIGGGYGYTGGNGGTVTIYGGKVEATSENGAGIGGGNITISGGTVEATGGNYGAGIGGSVRSGGNITISGGTVTATGGGDGGAGIGGGNITISGGDGGNITISGGTVTATGGGGGAGIGGGDGGNGGTVTISGGKVEATGGGAGIGGGNGGIGGSFSTGTAGSAVIFASSDSGSAIQDNDNTTAWQGVIFQGNTGQVYGTSVTPTEDFTIHNGKTLEIAQGKTLNIQAGVTLTNQGTVNNNGAVNNSGHWINKVTGITLPESQSLTVGGNTTLTAAVTRGIVTGAEVDQTTDEPAPSSWTWTSSGTTVATVEADQTDQTKATVTAVGAGEAKITATAGNYTDTCTVTVTAVPVTGVTLDQSTLNLTVGGTGTLTATVQPDNATNKAVTWTSDNEAVVTVDGGTVTAVGAGTATITVTTQDGGQTATCTVTVTQPVTGVILNQSALSLTVGGSATLTATVQPDNATNKAVTWESSNTAVATVDGGTVTAVGAGSATITATAADGSGVTATCAVTVTRPSSGGGSRPTPTPSQQATDKLESAQDGDTVTIDLPTGKTTLDKEVFEELAGRDVTLEIDLGDGLSWTIHGLDIPADAALTDLDMGVAMDTDTVPVDLINTITGEVGTLQLTLAHDGEFGFTLTLTAPLGEKNAGYWANLYYFDEDAETLTFQTSAKIDADGSAALVFTHASQYVIVIDDRDHTPKDFPFVDVNENDWFYEAVDDVFQRDLMTGTDETHFTPNGTASRAMVATILWRMADEPQATELLTFADVPAGTWYTEAVAWAAETGIVTGYSAEKFGPDDPVTREQFAAMLYRYAQTLGEGFTGSWSYPLNFPDADQVSDYAYEALCWMTMENVINGMEDGKLHPQGTATRAQLATMLMGFGDALSR